MKFSIERHAYAPELNKIHFNNGGALKAPSIKSIKEARKKITETGADLIIANDIGSKRYKENPQNNKYASRLTSFILRLNDYLILTVFAPAK